MPETFIPMATSMLLVLSGVEEDNSDGAQKLAVA